MSLHYSIVCNHKALHLDHVGSPGSGWGEAGAMCLIDEMNQLTSSVSFWSLWRSGQSKLIQCAISCNLKRAVHTDRQTNRQTDTHTDTQTQRAYNWLQVLPLNLTVNVGNDNYQMLDDNLF